MQEVGCRRRDTGSRRQEKSPLGGIRSSLVTGRGKEQRPVGPAPRRACHYCSFSQTELVKVASPGGNIRNCKYSPHLTVL